ncbi:MAG TPA: CPBP family intramembrane glutamic endopeptidase, partial [Halobacteriales archaeon]|nr:CPBP family intramembrane glutamic endopeptidase [Halobacteriales archaeon]
MRALLVGTFWPDPTPSRPLEFAALLAVSILVGSVVIVYLGFTRWVGVDLVGWWLDREHLLGDVLWGLFGFVVVIVANVALALSFLALVGPLPGGQPVGSAPSLVGTLLGVVFGFAVASFHEETLFRGFLQTAIADRVGEWPAVVLQAVAFSAAHVGYYPLSAWYLYVVAFVAGLVFGWLRKRRGRLVVPGIAHGLVGRRRRQVDRDRSSIERRAVSPPATPPSRRSIRRSPDRRRTERPAPRRWSASRGRS